jgi:hypothetical protein
MQELALTGRVMSAAAPGKAACSPDKAASSPNNAALYPPNGTAATATAAAASLGSATVAAQQWQTTSGAPKSSACAAAPARVNSTADPIRRGGATTYPGAERNGASTATSCGTLLSPSTEPGAHGYLGSSLPRDSDADAGACPRSASGHAVSRDTAPAAMPSQPHVPNDMLAYPGDGQVHPQGSTLGAG